MSEQTILEVNEVAKKTSNNEPWVLITSPVTAYKLNVIGAYVSGIKKLNYKNFAVLLCDNSETDDMYVSLKPVEEAFAKQGIKFYTVMTKHRTYIRERLVEGRNLARDVIDKRQDLSCYELSKEDEIKIRELQQIDFEYFFGLEQDVIPGADCLQRLIEKDKDAISGIYFNSKATKDPQTGVQGVSWIPMIWSWANEEVKEAEILVDTSIEYLMPSRVDRTAATGVGCIMVKSSVITAISNTDDFRPRIDQAVRNYLKENKDAKAEDLKQLISNMSQKLNEDNKTNTRSGVREETWNNYEFNIGDQKHLVNIITKAKTYGFRYDQNKFACDDMFFSLDIHRNGYSLWFDSSVWCRHLHQMWDTVAYGER